MLQQVSVEPKRLDDYVPIVGVAAVEEIRRLAEPLRGARVLHVNATAFGGGVAEILPTLVPLMRDVGLDAEWRIIYAAEEFFGVTKALHNALQGAHLPLTENMKEVYRRFSALNAEAFTGDYDFVIVHDPQPAALLHFHGRDGGRHWLWRCHLDTSTPNPEAWGFLKPYVEQYDGAVFTQPRYVAGDLNLPRRFFIPPSIDPLAPKNQLQPWEANRSVVACFRLDVARPMLLQVSRFDPWKDPLGVIDVYRMVKVEIPQVQLVLVGSMASDDPEGWDYYERTVRRAGEDFDIHILHNLHGVGNAEVNAFQSLANVVIQKSIREGFGLVVTEALWKGTPVVGSNVGGIPLQIVNGETGFLVDNRITCAERVCHVLSHPELRERMGQAAREHVRTRFLSPRHLRDYLEVFAALTSSAPTLAGESETEGRETRP